MGGCFSCGDAESTVYVPRSTAPVHRSYPVYPRTPPASASGLSTAPVHRSYPVYSRTPPASASRVQRFSTPYSYVKPAAPVRRDISVPYGRTVVGSKSEALYGEFRCSCGNFWVSLLTWRNKCQQCRRCKRQVYPTNQRSLQPTDFKKDKEDVGEHPMELCEMCKQMGGHCGKKKQTTTFRL